MTSKSNNFASSFAPYTPPPDDPATHQDNSARISKAWFPPNAQANASYQSGAVPTFNTSSFGSQAAEEAVESQSNQWETRLGLRVDALSAFAYVLGPVSALTLLIIETKNDYIRYHAYQSGLLSTPLLLTRIFASIVHFPQFLKIVINLVMVVMWLFMAVKAFIGAEREGLARYQLPVIGAIAEQWLSEE